MKTVALPTSRVLRKYLRSVVGNVFSEANAPERLYLPLNLARKNLYRNNFSKKLEKIQHWLPIFHIESYRPSYMIFLNSANRLHRSLISSYLLLNAELS